MKREKKTVVCGAEKSRLACQNAQPNKGLQATADSLVSLLVLGDVGESLAPNRRRDRPI
jgi:hypothetical protein